jgi:hypothetical protein
MINRCILFSFGTFFPVLVSCTYQEKSGNPGGKGFMVVVSGDGSRGVFLLLH